VSCEARPILIFAEPAGTKRGEKKKEEGKNERISVPNCYWLCGFLRSAREFQRCASGNRLRVTVPGLMTTRLEPRSATSCVGTTVFR
jgi:molybdenum cofactor biosynthesis enzyme MoaA